MGWSHTLFPTRYNHTFIYSYKRKIFFQLFTPIKIWQLTYERVTFKLQRSRRSYRRCKMKITKTWFRNETARGVEQTSVNILVRMFNRWFLSARESSRGRVSISSLLIGPRQQTWPFRKNLIKSALPALLRNRVDREHAVLKRLRIAVLVFNPFPCSWNAHPPLLPIVPLFVCPHPGCTSRSQWHHGKAFNLPLPPPLVHHGVGVWRHRRRFSLLPSPFPPSFSLSLHHLLLLPFSFRLGVFFIFFFFMYDRIWDVPSLCQR